MARRIGVLCVVCWGMSAVAWGAEKYDFSEFDAGELFIVQSALRTMEANESAYAYITVNQLKLDVLRMSNKPLTKPGGEHPEKTPPAADVFLLVGGLTKSPKVMKFLKARVSEHNQRLRDNQKKEANRTGSASSANSQATQTPTLRKPAAAQSDLDRLLLLICNGGAVNGEPLPVLTTDLDENSGPAWIERVKQMTSVGGPVGEAAKKLHPAVEDVQAAVDDYKAALARAGEASRNVRQRQEAAAALRNDPLYGASSSELQSMLDRGGQSAIRAQEYMAAAEAANFERFYSFVERIGAGLPELQAASARVHDRLARAEMRRHAVVADALVGPLRERAGPATMEPKLDMKYCVLASGSARHAWEKLAYFVVHSRSTAELTQLTLIAKIETSEGTRYVTNYTPSLPAGASARFVGATLDQGALQGKLGADGPQPEIKSVRYSVYCGQFQATDLEPQMITAEELVTDCWLQSAQPGLSYVTRADGTSLKTDRQYELKFRKLVPSKRGISVDFDLIDHANKNKSTHYHGTMTLPPVKLGGEGQVLHSYETMKFGFVQKPEERAVLIKTQAGRDALELELVGRWNSIERRWRTKLPNLGNVEFVTAGQVPTADSPEAKSRVAFQAALKLMQPGKMDEAKMAFEKVIDAYPETSGAESAKYMLSKFDQVKAGQAKAEEMRKSQEEFQRRMQQDQPQPSRKPKKPAKK